MSIETMTTRAETRAPEERRVADHNFRRGVLNGALFQAGEGFLDSNTVIPVFLSQLTTSNALIGLASSMAYVGWLFPQFAVLPWAARQPRQLSIYRRAATSRAIALGTLAAVTWPLSAHPQALLIAFFLTYSVYSIGGGFGAVSFLEVVGKTVPRERLGSFWAQRLLWGGLLAAGAGLVVRQILNHGPDGRSFALIFATGTALVTIGYSMFLGVREPQAPPAAVPSTPAAVLAEGLRLLRDNARFRRLLIARGGHSVWLTASPFLVLFAVRDLGGGPRATGTFLFARVTGFVLSNMGWAWLSRRAGNRAVLRAGSLGSGVMALAAAAIAVASPWSLDWIPAGTAVVLLEIVAFLGGAAESGLIVGYTSLVFEIAPPGRRQTFVSLMNTFAGITAVLPALGGAIVDAFSAPVLFALCAIGTLSGFLAARRLADSHGVPAEAAAGQGETTHSGAGR